MDKEAKHYLWINPVVEKMAGDDYPNLLEDMKSKGYCVVGTTDQVNKVRHRYMDYLLESPIKLVLDGRCPKVVQVIKQCYPQLVDNIPPIEPILISCAKELYEEYIKGYESSCLLTVVTPCSDLVEYGQQLFGNKITFITWREFADRLGYNKQYDQANSSPIPLGYFDSLPIRVLKASGEDEVVGMIGKVCKGQIGPDVDIIELLYCLNGCHHGDGV